MENYNMIKYHKARLPGKCALKAAIKSKNLKKGEQIFKLYNTKNTNTK